MANKNIKGLTVEIGGDTTKLGKALENVEKKSRNFSSELGEINRLLKFDPGNADLLAQKQKVLADAVSNTKEKLDTLKKAEAQVQKQFERGEVSEAQVRALQREIIATEGKMKNYKKQAKEAAKGTDKLADSADKAGESGEGMGKKLASAAKGGLTAMVTGAAAVMGALVGSAEATREYRGEMGKLETAFDTVGHKADTAQAAYKTLQGVIGETDQSVEAAQQIALLAESEADVAQWADLAAGVVGRFGDALQPETFFEAANETIKLGEATGAYTQMLEGTGYSVDEFNAGLAACNTEAEKQAYMLEITEQLLGGAADKYRETNAEVIRANEANEAWTATMAEAGAAVEPILTDVKLLGASLLSDLMPGIVGVTEAFRGLLNGDAGAADALGTALSGILSQLLTKIVEVLPAVTEAAMSLITTLVTTLISMLPQLVTTAVQLMMAILQGLTSAIPQVVDAIVQMIPQLVQALVTGIPQLIQGAVQLLLAIVQAIPLLIPPLTEAIPQIILAIIDGFFAAFPQLLEGTVQALMAIVAAIPVIINALVPQIPTIVTTLVDGLITNIPVLLDGAIQLLNAIVAAIPVIIEALIPQIPTIVNTIVNKLAEMAPVLLSSAVTLLWEIIKAIPKIVVAIGKNLPKVLTAITSILKAAPSLIWKILSQALGKVGTWIGNMVTKAREAGSKFITNVVNTIKGLPGKVATWLTNTISKVTTWASNLVKKGKQAAKDLVTSVANGVKELPSKMASIGKDLVRGLWNGINDMVGWVKGKISGFSKNVLDGIKGFFGVNSPARSKGSLKTTDWIGEMLDEGLAVGITNNADSPLGALSDLSDDMLDEAANMNGLTLERKLNHTFTPTAAASSDGGMLTKLDQIYHAILSGQVIMLDGKALVGSTADRYDGALGQRRILAERGAL